MELVAGVYGISFLTDFIIVSACSFICLRAVYQVSGPVCNSRWTFFMLLTFISCFVMISCPFEKL